MRVLALCIGLGLLCTLQSTLALNNGLAQKPPLAYSNWNIVGGAGQ